MLLEDRIAVGTSLVAQWLRLCASTVGGVGSVPGGGTKILHAVQSSHKQTNKQTKKKTEDIIVVTLRENGPGMRDEGALWGAGKVLFHDHNAGHTVLFIKLCINHLFLHDTSIKISKTYAY